MSSSSYRRQYRYNGQEAAAKGETRSPIRVIADIAKNVTALHFRMGEVWCFESDKIQKPPEWVVETGYAVGKYEEE